MEDGPNPWTEGPAEEELEESEDEGVLVEAILAEAGGDHGARAGADDVQDEQNDVPWGVNFDDGFFAGSDSFGGFEFGFILVRHLSVLSKTK